MSAHVCACQWSVDPLLGLQAAQKSSAGMGKAGHCATQQGLQGSIWWVCNAGGLAAPIARRPAAARPHAAGGPAGSASSCGSAAPSAARLPGQRGCGPVPASSPTRPARLCSCASPTCQPQDAEKLESAKAAAAAGAGGAAATLPLALSGGGAVGLGALLALATAGLSSALLGVTYRYAVRQDTANLQLKVGWHPLRWASGACLVCS